MALWAGVSTGDIQGDVTAWFRFFDNDGNLVHLPEEDAEQRAAIAAPRAERLAEKLRELKNSESWVLILSRCKRNNFTKQIFSRELRPAMQPLE